MTSKFILCFKDFSQNMSEGYARGQFFEILASKDVFPKRDLPHEE